MEFNPMAPSAEKAMLVTRDKLASFVGSGKVDVLATPMVVVLMEKAACELAQEYIEDTKTTVGTKINITHTAPTAEGMTLHARAQLVDEDGRTFRFLVQAWDEKGVVAEGEHERVAVTVGRFTMKALQRRDSKE